MIQNKLAHFNQ